MITGRKKMFLIVGVGIGLTLTIITMALLIFNINTFKSTIESSISATTGFDVRIRGKLNLSFIPLAILAKGITITSKGDEILSIESMKIRAEFLPLIGGRIKIADCELLAPSITIIQDARGKFNFESTVHNPSQALPGTISGWNTFKVSKGRLVYHDKKTGGKTELKGINLFVRNLHRRNSFENMIKNISFTGSLDCEELLQKDLTIKNFKTFIAAAKGVFTFAPITLDVFSGKGEGEIMVDETGINPHYKLNVMISNLDFEKIELLFGTKKIISGKGDLSATLTVNDKKGCSLIGNLNGLFSLKGNNLTTNTLDLDNVLSKYETAQKFHPADLAVFFIVGPLGNIVIREYRYRDLYNQTQGGHGDITQFISHWKIQSGEAEALDCALATHHNRVALKGRLNLVSNQYDSITVALLDNTGCPTLKQTINGSFAGPHTGAVSILESLASPVFDVYSKAKRFVDPGQCIVFYNGAVRPPH